MTVKRKRWFQFGLRAVLMAMLLTAVYFAGLNSPFQQFASLQPQSGVSSPTTSVQGPPTDQTVLAAASLSKGSKNVRIVKERIARYADAPRFFPRVGHAQLERDQYRCTIYYFRNGTRTKTVYLDQTYFTLIQENSRR